MIRYLNCLKKKSEITPEDFREFWNDAAFNELISEVANLSKAIRYTKDLVLQVEMGDRLLRDRGMSEPCDGVIEYYWESAAGLESLYETTQGQDLLGRIDHYQSQFIDLARSTAFFTECE
jgi:hypothetical protein